MQTDEKPDNITREKLWRAAIVWNGYGMSYAHELMHTQQVCAARSLAHLIKARKCMIPSKQKMI